MRFEPGHKGKPAAQARNISHHRHCLCASQKTPVLDKARAGREPVDMTSTSWCKAQRPLVKDTAVCLMDQ